MEFKIGDHVVLGNISEDVGIILFMDKFGNFKIEVNDIYIVWVRNDNIKLDIAYYRDLKLKELGI